MELNSGDRRFILRKLSLIPSLMVPGEYEMFVVITISVFTLAGLAPGGQEGPARVSLTSRASARAFSAKAATRHDDPLGGDRRDWRHLRTETRNRQQRREKNAQRSISRPSMNASAAMQPT